MEKWIRTNFLLMLKGKSRLYIFVSMLACMYELHTHIYIFIYLQFSNSKPKQLSKTFLIVFTALYCSSNLISGLLSIKCDATRREKIEEYIQKVDVNELEVRPSKHSAENSKRSVLSARRSIKKDQKSFNRSTSIHKMLTRSRSISMMEIEDESSCSRRRSLM